MRHAGLALQRRMHEIRAQKGEVVQQGRSLQQTYARIFLRRDPRAQKDIVGPLIGDRRMLRVFRVMRSVGEGRNNPDRRIRAAGGHRIQKPFNAFTKGFRCKAIAHIDPQFERGEIPSLLPYKIFRNLVFGMAGAGQSLIEDFNAQHAGGLGRVPGRGDECVMEEP